MRRFTHIAATFSPSGFFVLRTPLRPLETLRRWTGTLATTAALDAAASDDVLEQSIATDRAWLRDGLRAWLDDAPVRDAIHVASPDLGAALHYWNDDPDADRGQRVERSLVRYVTRLASRPTPFGLFAGSSVGVVGSSTNLQVASASEYRRLTRLDTAYLIRLIDALSADPQLSSRLRYRPNDTLYRSPGRWRYVEWRRDEAAVAAGPFYERSHHLVAIDDTPAIRSTLERANVDGGATKQSLADALVTDKISIEQALGFVEKLIDNQVLRPDLALVVTGEMPLPALERALRDYDAPDVADRLRDVQAALDAIDAQRVGADAASYDAIASNLESLPAKIDRGHLFHVDLLKPSPEARIGTAITRELAAGAEVLRRIGRSDDSELNRFRSAFVARYETRSVPLLEVLDDEMGIGFPIRGEGRSDAEALLAGLAFPPRSEAQLSWGAREAKLLRLLTEALSAGRREIVLTSRDIEALSTQKTLPLADAFSVMGTIAAPSPEALERGDFKIVMSHANGPSGAQLLGRFCFGDPMLTDHVRRHLRAEEALAPDAVFAEVVHLAHPRAGNLVGRPVLRDFEISYMGRSCAPHDRQISAADLFVSIEHDRVVLRSAKLGKRVLPRLASAHVYTAKAVSLYRFLGALQMQGVTGSTWSWGPLAEAAFLPRVCHGRLVFSLARWRMLKDELEALGKHSGAALMRAVREWRQRHALPRLVTVADADNTLLVDLDNVLSVESFVQLVRKREVLLLDEVHPGEDELCARGPEGAFTHEIIVPFVRTAASTEATPAPSSRATTGTRRLAPGSEWVYAKLYSGAPTADRVLRDVVAPFVKHARGEGWIDRWFFIRYADPDPHLRVRFHGDPGVLQTHLVPALHAGVAAEVDTGRVWRVQMDTYEREVERYGGHEGILIAERIFEVDSDAAVALAALSAAGRLPAADRWRVALVSADRLLADLGLRVDERRTLVESLRDAYRREHGLEPPYARPISDRFRTERSRLALMFAAEPDAQALGRGAFAALDILRKRSDELAPLATELKALADAGQLTQTLSDLAGSYVHMTLVRQLRASVRAQEAVIYDFLARLYSDPRLFGGRE